MPDWLTATSAGDVPETIESLAARLAIALACGIAVAIIYRLSHGRDNREHITLATTIVLLCVLIAMVTMIIGSNVARAFSLVGALSIVRFRTIVEDTRDTAFVIFAVVVGMAAGSAHFLVPLIGIPIVGAAAIVMSRSYGNGTSESGGRWTLVVRIALGRDSELLIGPVLARHVASRQLIATSTARQGAVLELTFETQLRRSVSPEVLVNELNAIDGVQGVELRHS